MRKCSVGTVETSNFVNMQLDIGKVACEELFLVPIVSISLTTNNKIIIMGPKSTLHQFPSNQRFVRLASRSFRVTTLSNNNGENNIRVKQRKPRDMVADMKKILEEEGEDGEKLKEELSACQHFLVDTEMENGRYKVFNFQMSKLDTKIA